MYEMCAKNIFKREIYVYSKFSCVCSPHDLCASAHAHSLEGTLVVGNDSMEVVTSCTV